MEVQNKKNVVHDLLETGKSKGSLTTKEISDAFGDMDICRLTISSWKNRKLNRKKWKMPCLRKALPLMTR